MRNGRPKLKRLGGWDAVLLYSETPNLPQHTLKIAVVDASGCDSFDFERFRSTLARRLHLMDPLRYRLIDIPGRMHHPMWLENFDVDLNYHLRRVRVTPPGGAGELDTVVGEVANGLLDRSRPLWEFYFIEGMADNRFAIIGKMHHALADGVASANLIARALDVSGRAPFEKDSFQPDPAPSASQLVRAAMRDHAVMLRQLPRLVGDTVTGAWRLSRKRSPAPGMARSFRPPTTFLNHVVSPRRTFASATMGLGEVKQTSKRLGVTINDVVLAIVTGAVRNLLLKYDGCADQALLAGVPVSIDTSPHRVSGNALGSLVVSLPVHTADPLEWIRLAHVGARTAKESNQLLGPDLMTRWMNYAPPGLTERVLRRIATSESPNRLVNIPVSNVQGPRHYGSIAGAKLERFYSVGPLTFGVGVNITVWSYVDQLNIAVLADDVTFGDPHEVTEAMIESFTLIQRAAGVPTAIRP